MQRKKKNKIGLEYVISFIHLIQATIQASKNRLSFLSFPIPLLSAYKYVCVCECLFLYFWVSLYTLIYPLHFDPILYFLSSCFLAKKKKKNSYHKRLTLAIETAFDKKDIGTHLDNNQLLFLLVSSFIYVSCSLLIFSTWNHRYDQNLGKRLYIHTYPRCIETVYWFEI